MLTAIVTSALILAPQSAGSPGPLVSKMLAQFSSARTLKGEILYTQAVGGQSIHGKTHVQYERPAKIFVRQTVDAPGQMPVRIISNGVRFLYSLPPTLASGTMAADPRQELVEPVLQLDPVQRQDRMLDMAEIYGIGASALIPRPVPLDLAVARLDDLKVFRGQLATVADEGTETIEGKNVRLIGGDWRAYDSAPVSGKYQLAITDSGDLVRYVQRELVADPRPNMPALEVVTTWIVRFQLNGPVDAKQFEDAALSLRRDKQKP